MDTASYHILGSRRHFTGRVVGLRVDEVTMPDGQRALREVVEHDAAVAVVAQNDAGNVALIEQYRHPFCRRLWEIPAGLMDIAGESPVDTARRELVEETGFDASCWQLLATTATSPGFCTEQVHIFLATSLTEVGRIAPTGDEESDLRLVWVDLDDALAAIFDGGIISATAICGITLTAAVAGSPAHYPLRSATSAALSIASRPDLSRDTRW